ncbi:MAG: TRAP transporter small permease [Desulfobacteraceae bacterium]|nr:MAG: TRAP transporter small permease [Desulfobacteraceae bacterium]
MVFGTKSPPGKGMGWFLRAVHNVSRGLSKIAEVALACMILLTVTDVILRTGRSPIVGTYEMVGLLGAVIISFSIPLTSWLRVHIRVDFAVLSLPPRARATVDVITRLIGFALFITIGWHLLILGAESLDAGEVTPTRHIPLYPIMYAVGVASFLQALVLFCDVVRVVQGRDE